MLTFAWEWAETGPEPEWRLTRVSITGNGPKEDDVTLTPRSAAQCQAWWEQSFIPGQTRCTEVACPKPGAYAVTLQAQRGATSQPSNVLQFGIGPGPSCPVIGFGDAVLATLIATLPRPLQGLAALVVPMPASAAALTSPAEAAPSAPSAPSATTTGTPVPALPLPSREVAPPAQASAPPPVRVDTPPPALTPDPAPGISIADWPVLTP
jgi:hypothetical protein